MSLLRLMNHPPFGLRLWPYGPPLRVSPESLDRLGILSESKDKVRSTASKPARKQTCFLAGAYSRSYIIRE